MQPAMHPHAHAILRAKAAQELAKREGIPLGVAIKRILDEEKVLREQMKEGMDEFIKELQNGKLP